MDRSRFQNYRKLKQCKNMNIKLLRQLIYMSKFALYGMVLQCFFFSVLFANEGNAQKYKSIKEVFVTINFNNDDLLAAFSKIESVSDLHFAFNKEDIVKDVKFNKSFENISVYDILLQIAQESGLKFQQVNHMINVSAIPDQKPDKDNSIEINLQAVTVEGTVKDKDGEPIPGVNIVVKGRAIGTTTDFNGYYSLSVPDNSSILAFSFIGYLTQEIRVGNRSEINVVMAEDVQSLEEIVIVGYGKEEKVNLIGSVSSISSEEVQAAPVAQISNALAGRLPGAIVQQTSGEPGFDEASILIRGASTLGNANPLVVIDGIPGRDLNSVRATDVESISILKDASAAIYGARAANGVILVTTKRGKENTPATINYNFYEGVMTPTMLPEKVDAATYAQRTREAEWYRGTDESNMTFSLEDIEKYRSGEHPWTHPNTDWFDAALSDYTRTSNHNVSISGGSNTITYFTSLGMQLDEGIYTNSASSFERLDFRGNLDYKINDNLSVGLLTNLQQANRMSPTTSTNHIYYSVIASLPTSVATYPNGLPGPDIEYGYQPMVTPSFIPGFNDNKRYQGNVMVSADFKIPGIDGLSLSGYYAYDKTFGRTKLWEKPYTLYQLDEAAYLNAGNTGIEDGSDFLIGSPKGVPEPRLSESFSESGKSTVNTRLTYDKTFDDVHNLEAFVAYEHFEYDAEGFSAFRRHFISDQLPYLFAGGEEEKDNDGWVDLDAQMNYFGRVSYNYDETYLFQFTFRRDGSLRFSKEHGRWGNFPSVLVGYKPSEQEWWKNSVGFIDFFKIRGSWGKMGNDQIPSFQYLSSYDLGGGAVLGSARSYMFGLYQSTVPNPFITWEVANMYNLGIESKFLDHRFTFNVDLFKERREDILIQRNASVPRFTGLSLPEQNFGVVENKGFELLLGYNESKGDFIYSLEGNFAFARNEIVDFDEPEQTAEHQTLTGHPMGSILLYKSLGFFESEEQIRDYELQPGATIGDPIILDYNGDGELTNLDMIVFDQTSAPQITFGMSFNVSYKNWRLGGLLQGVSNTYRTPYGFQSSSLWQRNVERAGWTPDQVDTSVPYNPTGPAKPTAVSYTSDALLENKAYMRMKNLNLSYTLPQRVQDALGTNNFTVSLSGQNLFMIYPNKNEIMMDPEIAGIRSYPLMKVYTLGLNVGL